MYKFTIGDKRETDRELPFRALVRTARKHAFFTLQVIDGRAVSMENEDINSSKAWTNAAYKFIYNHYWKHG